MDYTNTQIAYILLVNICVQPNTTYDCWYNTLERRHVSAQNIAFFRPYANVRTDQWSLHCTDWWWHLSNMVCKYVFKSILKITNCTKNTKGDHLSVLGSIVRTVKYFSFITILPNTDGRSPRNLARAKIYISWFYSKIQQPKWTQ
jgi:hypothetical protein